MQRYTKTNWVVDVTKVNPTNMNKIENQLETVTDELITPTHEHSQYLTQHQDISGKENSSNKVTSISSSSTNTQYPSAKCVYDAINNAIASVLDLRIVQTLPTQDISTTTIYLLRNEETTGSNLYDEYVYTNNNWEKIGNTSINLSNYYTKTEIDNLFDELDDKIWIGTQAQYNALPSYSNDIIYFIKEDENVSS